MRAVSRVLALRAGALGIRKAPWAHTILHGVRRLTLVRLDAARTVRGVPRDLAPLTPGLLWRIASRIGLGAGTLVAVLAWAAHPPQLEAGAPALRHGHGLGGAVADAWTGDTMAAVLKRLIAPMGRPAASLTDHGSERQKAVALRADDGLDSPCLDDRSPGAAGMRTRPSQPHPACERFVSAGGRASGTLQHTLLAGVAPPTVRPKARFMPVHRCVTWADRVLQLSPSGGAPRGSMCATRRSALEALPDCHALRKRLQGEAGALLACQARLKNRGLGTATVAQGAARIDAMPTAALGQECRASLTPQLGIATPGGRAQGGVPIRADAIAALGGVGTRHGGGETPDAARIALRLPAFCGRPTREEAEHVLGVRVARQHACTAARPSLTQQRREVFAHPERLERVVREPASPHVERIPSPKTHAKQEVSIDMKKMERNEHGTPCGSPDESMVIANAGLPSFAQMAFTS